MSQNNNLKLLELKAKQIASDALFDYLPISFYWMDIKGYFLGCNERVLRHLKISNIDDFVGKHSTEVASLEAWENSEEVICTKKSSFYEEEHVHEDGSKIYYLSIKSPIIDKKEEVIGLVGISIDITKQKDAERMKLEFMSNMEHDLRTPLAGLLGISNHLYKTEDDEKRKELLGLVLLASQRLLDIHNEILKFRQIELLPYQITEFNIKDVLQEIIDLMMPEVKIKNLEILFSCPNEILKSDRMRISRILLNLISNAIRYTNEGKIEVNIQTVPKLKIEVKDTGIGIPKDKLDIIFDRFTKVDLSEIHPEFTGLGIGLNIVKRFAQELGGKVIVSSEINKGSCFTFSL
jgi:two-component system aerobic respiration control sensor histidine kinase ArcB